MNDFICPHCKAYLNVCDFITFAAERSNGEKGLVLLHPEVGIFESDIHPKFQPNEGELVRFRCPACHISLTSSKSEKLAHIQAVDSDNVLFDVYFSKIKGEKSTFKVEGKSVKVYGEHAEQYVNYFNLSQVK